VKPDSVVFELSPSFQDRELESQKGNEEDWQLDQVINSLKKRKFLLAFLHWGGFFKQATEETKLPEIVEGYRYARDTLGLKSLIAGDRDNEVRLRFYGRLYYNSINIATESPIHLLATIWWRGDVLEILSQC
jgi:hypothetical protein